MTPTPALLRNAAACLENGMTPKLVADELRSYADAMELTRRGAEAREGWPQSKLSKAVEAARGGPASTPKNLGHQFGGAVPDNHTIDEWVPWKHGDPKPPEGIYWVTIQRRHYNQYCEVDELDSTHCRPLTTQVSWDGEDVIAYLRRPLPPPHEARGNT